ncbi:MULTISPECIES: thioredoxin family protein [unclassified Flavobacterium]|uniref:thioredoxin family protein n=1 Tax=unclassified Flavobacterium TaxID=196869 RepID=UPI003F8F0752
MFRKKAAFIILIVIVMQSSFAQLKTYTFQEAELLSKENPKPIVVFIHTYWCNYCKMMENNTFKNKEVIAELNTNFYFISFDAETKEPIAFNQNTFQFQPTGTNTGIHELATALATINGQVMYPTLTVLATDASIIFQQHSYISAKTFLKILEKMDYK